MSKGRRAKDWPTDRASPAAKTPGRRSSQMLGANSGGARRLKELAAEGHHKRHPRGYGMAWCGRPLAAPEESTESEDAKE